MIITTATTVNTVKYLSLLELEQYKKQFQSFWIPFMEQFIPATTVWVAGERWCNEPCTIISPCDYDFELVEAEISYQEIPPGFFPTTSQINPQPCIKCEIPIGIKSTTEVGVPAATFARTSPSIVQTNDLGLTTSRNIIITEQQSKIDIATYRNNFTPIETQIR